LVGIPVGWKDIDGRSVGSDEMVGWKEFVGGMDGGEVGGSVVFNMMVGVNVLLSNWSTVMLGCSIVGAEVGSMSATAMKLIVPLLSLPLKMVLFTVNAVLFIVMLLPLVVLVAVISLRAEVLVLFTPGGTTMVISGRKSSFFSS
jgi:hypothetical protein